jgi:hypothetical protein
MGVALLALAIALSGTAYAANKIGSNQIKANAVTTSKIKNNAVTPAKTSAFKTLGNGIRMVATDGPTLDAARAAAPARRLFRKGPLTIYAKCYRDSVLNTLEGSMFMRTTRDFSIMEGDDDRAGGAAASDYLNRNTLEPDRQLDGTSVTGTDTAYDETEAMAAAPGGPRISILTGVGVKNGPAFANGPYGPGNSCIFQGGAFG